MSSRCFDLNRLMSSGDAGKRSDTPKTPSSPVGLLVNLALHRFHLLGEQDGADGCCVTAVVEGGVLSITSIPPGFNLTYSLLSLHRAFVNIAIAGPCVFTGIGSLSPELAGGSTMEPNK